jgi:hypothetical protein
LILVLLAAPAAFVKVFLLHPRPREVLSAVEEAYRTLPCYSDDTTVDVGTFGRRGSYRLWFARPNRLRVEFHGIADDAVMVSDGKMLYTYVPGRNEYTATKAPDPLPDEFPTGQPSLTLALLNGHPIFPTGARLGYAGRRSCGGVRGAHTYSVEAPPSPGPGITGMSLTVGADQMIHCASVTVRVGDEDVTYDLIHAGISAAPPPEGAFHFEPPPGARRVADDAGRRSGS